VTDRNLPLHIRTTRGELGLTQAGLAALLGVTETTVRRWERGQSAPTPAPMLRLALQQLQDHTSR
jgi:DNA-binding transcriptional regulator YiaG